MTDKGTSAPKAINSFNRNRFTLTDAIIFIILTVLAVTIVMPFYFSIMISFVEQEEYIHTPFIIWPQKFNMQSYKNLLEGGSIFQGYKNTFYHLVWGMPLSMIITFSLGYVLSRPKFPGKTALIYFVLITMIFSGGTIPAYMNIRELGLMNNRWAIILSNVLSTYYAILIMNYIRTLPESLFESARLDGAGEAQILFLIVFPLSLPIIATIGLFFLVDKWNEWYGSMLYLNRSTDYPLQLVLQNIINTFQVAEDENVSQAALDEVKKTQAFSMGMKMAAVVCTMLPVMLVFPFLQRFFVKGITLGAVKE